MTAHQVEADGFSARRRRGFSAAAARGAQAAMPLALAFGGLGLGAGFAFLASQGGGVLETFGLLSGAAAAGGFGAFGLIERLMLSRAASASTDLAGDAGFYELAPDPMVVLDRSGRVLAANAAARRGSERALRHVGDVIRGCADADEHSYRLLRAALRGEPAEAVFGPSDDGDERHGVRVSAWPLGGGRIAWRWLTGDGAEADAAVAAPLAPLASASVAWMHVGGDGRILSASPILEQWLGRLAMGVGFHAIFPDAARRIAHRGARSERVLARTRFIGGPEAPKVVSLLYSIGPGRGEAVIIATPAPRSEAANIAPLGAADKLLGAFDALQSVRLFEDAPIGVMLLSAEGRVLRLNAAADRLLAGAAPANFEDRLDRVMSGALGDRLIEWIGEASREDAAAQLRAAGEGLASDGVSFEAQFGQGDGEGRRAQCYLSQVDSPNGRMLLCYLIDASEQHGLQERFLQAQKMNAVGTLAGGMAHDFNNLLSVILGESEELMQRLTLDHAFFEYVSAIYQSAHRAAELVRNMLAFSRKQELRPQLVNLTDRLSDLSYILNRMIGDHISLRQDLSEELWNVRVDITAFEQAVTNLVLNARDAMPEGGVISLSTENVRLDSERRTPRFAMPPGEYVRVAVRDNGSGIPTELLGKIFEPFFSTKQSGFVAGARTATGAAPSGTGLGLPAVYGAVKQSGGYVFVDSEVGLGTIFEIFLPRDRDEPAERDAVSALEADIAPMRMDEAFASPRAAAAAPLPTFADAPPEPPTRRDGRAPVVLLVEDEEALRGMVARYLANRGFEVIEAEGGEEALVALEDADQPIDVMLSDVVMPNMDGPTLLRRLGDRRPQLKTIFMTGYARDAFAETLESSTTRMRSFDFLQKPFKLDEMRAAVARALSEPGDAA